MSDRAKKIALIACILALIGFGYALIPQDVAFEVVLNNTNLAPSFVGGPTGTNERVSGTTYWTNISAIQILLFCHGMTVADTTTIELWVNGTLVLVTSGKPLGGAETSNKSLSMIIPKGSYYHVIFNNFHHYEWREYPIISGRNGTLSINQTIINSGGGGASFNGNPVDMNGSNLFNGTISNYSTNVSLNASLDLKVNKSGDNMTGTLRINTTEAFVFNDETRSVFMNNPLKYFNWSGQENVTMAANDPLFSVNLQGAGIKNINNLITFRRIDNAGFPFFIGSRARGYYYPLNGSAYPKPVQSGDFLMRFSANGYDNVTWTSSTGFMDVMADGLGEWNYSSHPTYLSFGTTNNGSTAATEKIRMRPDGNLTIKSMAGTGNRYVCVNSEGTLYAGNPTC